MNDLQFFQNSPATRTLQAWWKDLENNTGDRAALRRCNKPLDVAFIPAFHELCRELNPRQPDRLLPVAGLVARLKGDVAGELPKHMATAKSGGGPRVSELRFRRLLQCQSGDELFTDLRRLLDLLDNKTNLASLADAAYWWSDRIRKHWAYAYYGELQSIKSGKKGASR